MEKLLEQIKMPNEYYSYFKVFTALRLIGNIGFYTWVMFFVIIYLIYKKELQP